MNCLLVGGAADGRRVVIPDGKKHYDVAIYEKISIERDLLEPIRYEVQHYNFFELHPVTRAVIFAHESLTPTQIMEALMDGYRQEKI